MECNANTGESKTEVSVAATGGGPQAQGRPVCLVTQEIALDGTRKRCHALPRERIEAAKATAADAWSVLSALFDMGSNSTLRRTLRAKQRARLRTWTRKAALHAAHLLKALGEDPGRPAPCPWLQHLGLDAHEKLATWIRKAEDAVSVIWMQKVFTFQSSIMRRAEGFTRALQEVRCLLDDSWFQLNGGPVEASPFYGRRPEVLQ